VISSDGVFGGVVFLNSEPDGVLDEANRWCPFEMFNRRDVIICTVAFAAANSKRESD
jgi:hypothetical protein